MNDVRAVSEGVAQQIQEFLRSTVDPLRERFLFAARPSDGAIRADPMVVFVGNHSSGKSTFINHLLGATVQETGMAPTHDDFTILRHGETPREVAGEALLSNPDLGFTELAAFGPSFARRIKMRAGPFPILERVQLVDTPGMIDSADRSSKREYDFDGVVAWLARRADLVVLFFDPERPGTTAETVDVFARSLASLDHKLVVVFNKVDQFRNVTDFARCYGTLCWNLGKVLRTKDLPQIHPCYIEVESAQKPVLPMAEFDAPRDQLLERIRNAPNQRADNLITETARYIENLVGHADVLTELRRRALRGPRKCTWIGVLVVLAAISVAGAALSLPENPAILQTLVWLTVTIAITIFATGYARRSSSRAFVARLGAEIEESAATVEGKARARGANAERARQILDSVKDLTAAAAHDLAPWRLPHLRGSERRALVHWIESTMPSLRRSVHLRTTSKPPAKPAEFAGV